MARHPRFTTLAMDRTNVRCNLSRSRGLQRNAAAQSGRCRL